ncbi:MAG: transporter, partial [Pseudarthrobacter sp.]|nr:transporter [Pseudarthrobacter sp.]
MGKLTVLALRIVIAMVLAGSLFVQVWMVPLVSTDL